MMVLNASTDSLELATSAGASTDYHFSYADVEAATLLYAPAATNGNVASATETSVIAAPAAGHIRQVKGAFVRNRSLTAAQGIIVQVDVSGTEYQVFAATLQPGEVAIYTDALGWYVLTTSGRKKVVTPQQDVISSYPREYQKVGTSFEAAGVFYCWAKDVGFPGPWATGSPGVAGRATDGTAAGDAGCILYTNAASGYNYLTGWSGSASVTGKQVLYDFMWVNTAVVVTTTTAQTLNSVAFPARDNQGAINGEGCVAGILVTAATTNVGAITNTTLTYTNSDGTASRTGTITSFPATAVVGTVVFFELQAGDKGIQSIQSITLGTSYAGGSISVFVARRLASLSQPVVQVGGNAPIDPSGVRLYDGTCMLLVGNCGATTATTISGEIFITNR